MNHCSGCTDDAVSSNFPAGPIALLSTFLLLFLASPGRGDGVADARMVIAAGIKALGSEAKHGSYKAAVCDARGRIFLAGESFPCKIRLVYQPPSQYCLHILGDTFKIATVLNGEQGWTRMNNLVVAMSKEQLDEARETMHAEHVTGLAPLLCKSEYVLSLLGTSKIEEIHAIGVRVRHRGRRDVKLFFDMKTGLLAKMETTVKENGVSIIQEVFLHNWDLFGHVHRPRR